MFRVARKGASNDSLNGMVGIKRTYQHQMTECYSSINLGRPNGGLFYLLKAANSPLERLSAARPI